MNNDRSLKRRRHPDFTVSANPTNTNLVETLHRMLDSNGNISNHDLIGLLQTFIQKNNIGGNELTVSNSVEGDTGQFKITTAREVHTLAAAATSDTTTLTIPVGSMLLGASFSVNTAVTTSGATDTWEAAFVDGSTTALAPASTAGALNTKSDVLIVPEISATNPCEIQFDAAGAETFVTGVIEVIVYYATLVSLADA